MQLREAALELERRRVAVLVVTFDDGPLARNYASATGLTWPLLVDHDRGLYHAYGMLRGRAWDLYGPPAIWVYLKLLFRGRRLARPGSDVTQLGGDVVIDEGGSVRLHHIGRGPADRPSVADLLAAIDATRAEL